MPPACLTFHRGFLPVTPRAADHWPASVWAGLPLSAGTGRREASRLRLVQSRPQAHSRFLFPTHQCCSLRSPGAGLGGALESGRVLPQGLWPGHLPGETALTAWVRDTNSSQATQAVPGHLSLLPTALIMKPPATATRRPCSLLKGTW